MSENLDHPALLARKSTNADLPLVVSPKKACELLNIGTTYLYELINRGALVSYTEGRSRKIVTDSILTHISRRIAESSQAEGGRP